MSRRPYPGLNFCPCKSGKPYKKCCQPKKIEYFIRHDGKVVRESVLDDDQRSEYLQRKEEFVQQHKRQPTEEEDGVLRMSGGFIDFTSVIEQDLVKSGASEEVLYAFRKTGIVVTRENEAQVTPGELQRWETAILEYRKLKAT